MNVTGINASAGEVMATTTVETTMTESRMVTAALALIGLYLVFRWAARE